MTLVNKSRVLYKSSGYYLFYSTSWSGPIFFPSENIQDGNTLNILNGKQGYFVANAEGKYLRDFAKAYAVKIVPTKGKGAAFDDSVYLIPVEIMYTKQKFRNNYSDSVQILRVDTLIRTNIHQYFDGDVIKVDAPFIPKAFD